MYVFGTNEAHTTVQKRRIRIYLSGSGSGSSNLIGDTHVREAVQDAQLLAATVALLDAASQPHGVLQ